MSAAPPTGRASVSVPASTSNLGAGFDCIGFAVDLELTASVIVHGASAPASPGGNGAGPAVTIERRGTLAGLDSPPDEDLLYVGFAAACNAFGRAVPARLAFTAASEIPVSRGLGSSSAALIAGAALANAALSLGRTRDAIAILCARLEGHPDNVAPAVFGGAVLGVPVWDHGELSGYVFAPLAVHDDLAFAFAVPDFHVTTSEARAALPSMIEHRQAVAAAAKSAALVQGLAIADRALLTYALDDVLHVPFRQSLIPGYAEVTAAAVAAGAFGATLSGSGSTLLAVAPPGRIAHVATEMERAWASRGVSARAFVQRHPASARLSDAGHGNPNRNTARAEA